MCQYSHMSMMHPEAAEEEEEGSMGDIEVVVHQRRTSSRTSHQLQQ